MEKRPQIFLSYAREDQEQVKEIYDQLKALGFSPWMDTEDLLPGQDWKNEIGLMIRQSDFALIFLSAKSVSKRGYVQKEFKLAREILDELPRGEIFIIPVRLSTCDIPEDFKDIHCVDLFVEGGFAKVITTLRRFSDDARTKAVIGLAIQSAVGFWRAGLATAPRKNLPPGASPIGDIVSSAINLSLALGLQLEALLLLCKIGPHHTHDLKVLYAQIPEDIRSSLSEVYRQLLEADPVEESELSIKGFHFSDDPQELMSRNFRADTVNPELAELLENHSNTFEPWRYIHEIPESMRFDLSYDFRSMNAAITAVSAHTTPLARRLNLILDMHEGRPPDNWGSVS